MKSLTVPSSFLFPTADNMDVNPAMLSALWHIGDELDRMRVPEKVEDAVWVKLPSRSLRNPDGRNDNVWLKTCLNRLLGLKLGGEYRGNEWGAVMIAEWRFTQGGQVTEILLPPAAIAVLRAPKTFAKIELAAVYELGGHARRLYAALADKKRMGQHWWTYSLEELRDIFDARGKYKTWNDFNRYVLKPTIKKINDFGTVHISMSVGKTGKTIDSVRFDWKWKDIDAAIITGEENARHSTARGKAQHAADAPPLVKEGAAKEGTEEERTARIEEIYKEQGWVKRGGKWRIPERE